MKDLLIIAIVVLAVPALGLLSGGGAFAQDPANVQAAVSTAQTTIEFGPVILCGVVVLALLFGAVSIASRDVQTIMNGVQAVLPIWEENRRHRRHDEIEWESDTGAVIGYRYVSIDKNTGEFWSTGVGSVGRNPVTGRERGRWRSWSNTSDRVPTMNNKSGIYAAKTVDSPILRPYADPGMALVKVRLSGRIIEADYGYRAHECEIIEVLDVLPERD